MPARTASPTRETPLALLVLLLVLTSLPFPLTSLPVLPFGTSLLSQAESDLGATSFASSFSHRSLYCVCTVSTASVCLSVSVCLYCVSILCLYCVCLSTVSVLCLYCVCLSTVCLYCVFPGVCLYCMSVLCLYCLYCICLSVCLCLSVSTVCLYCVCTVSVCLLCLYCVCLSVCVCLSLLYVCTVSVCLLCLSVLCLSRCPSQFKRPGQARSA